MGNLAEDALVNIYPEISTPMSKEAKMLAYYMVPWHCGLENSYCLTASKENFDKVKSGTKVWRTGVKAVPGCVPPSWHLKIS